MLKHPIVENSSQSSIKITTHAFYNRNDVIEDIVYHITDINFADEPNRSVIKQFVTHCVIRKLLPIEWIYFNPEDNYNNPKDIYDYDKLHGVIEKWKNKILSKAYSQLQSELSKADNEYYDRMDGNT